MCGNIEKGCQWNFASGINFNFGPTDAAEQNFDGSWESLVRECIQNSLDAVRDSSKPVTVRFEFKKLPMRNFKNFFALEEHIQACLDTYATAKNQYEPMLNYFNSLKSPDSKMGYLQISDFNTVGMAYDKNNDSCNFTAFVRSVGVHGGELNAFGRGGRFGLGKSTIFSMSAIKTIFVSTYTMQNQYVFEGVTSLTTHKLHGERLSHIGYYDSNNGLPITDKSAIPERFLRTESDENGVLSGTDLYVMGRMEDNGDVDDIIKNVLTHYWLSIFREKLIVEVIDISGNKTVLNHSALDNYMQKVFPTLVDNARNVFNPRPYYEAVVHVDTIPGAVCIKRSLPMLGEVELYLTKNSNAKSDRIACFRLPCMMVMRKSTSQLHLNISNFGVYGVFVCVDKEGDKRLKKVENPAHDEWLEKHWKNPISGRITDSASQLMEEFRNFLAEEIECFCKTKGTATLKMLGAGKYLYTIQDFVDTSSEDVKPNPDNGVVPGSDFVDNETGIKAADSNSNVKINFPHNTEGPQSGNVTDMDGKAAPDNTGKKSGSINVLVTPPKKKHNKTNDKNKGGTKEVPGIQANKPAVIKVPIEFKIYANQEKDYIIHHICIVPEIEVESALIQFISKREDGRIDTELEIVDSFGIGNPKNMLLSNVLLKRGNNMLKIRFNDNMKHALDINVQSKNSDLCN